MSKPCQLIVLDSGKYCCGVDRLFDQIGKVMVNIREVK